MGMKVKWSDVCACLSVRDFFASIVSKSLLYIQKLSVSVPSIDTHTHTHTQAMTL